jgi:hypothetical protein
VCLTFTHLGSYDSSSIHPRKTLPTTYSTMKTCLTTWLQEFKRFGCRH